MQSTLTLSTSDGKRITKRLSNHWQHKFEIVIDNDTATILFSEYDKVVLSSTEDSLVCVLTTSSEETCAKLQEVVLNHINRMAGIQFEGVWTAV